MNLSTAATVTLTMVVLFDLIFALTTVALLAGIYLTLKALRALQDADVILHDRLVPAAVLELAASSEGHGRLQVPGLDIFRSFEWLRIGRPVPGGGKAG